MLLPRGFGPITIELRMNCNHEVLLFEGHRPQGQVGAIPGGRGKNGPIGL